MSVPSWVVFVALAAVAIPNILYTIWAIRDGRRAQQRAERYRRARERLSTHSRPEEEQ